MLQIGSALVYMIYKLIIFRQVLFKSFYFQSRANGMVPKVRIRRQSLVAEGNGARDRMCSLLAWLL